MLITIKEHCCTTLNLENNNNKNNKSVVVYKRKRRKVFNREGECSHTINKLFLSLKESQKLAVLNSEKITQKNLLIEQFIHIIKIRNFCCIH